MIKGPVKYLVYWKDMLKKNQGDAPMHDFDTTIEAEAYIIGIIHTLIVFDKKNKKTENQYRKEFLIKEIPYDYAENQN
mgnify:FL=1